MKADIFLESLLLKIESTVVSINLEREIRKEHFLNPCGHLLEEMILAVKTMRMCLRIFPF